MLKAFGFLISFGILASTGTIVNFDTCPLGKTPPGWTVAMTDRGDPPRWEVLRDQSAPTQPYVLGQTSSDPTRVRLPLAILDGVSLRDGDISVRLKPVSGREDQSGGLVFRYRDDKNYYLARADARTRQVSVYRVVDGRTLPLSPRGMPSALGVTHDILPNTWSILKVSVRGNRFQIYVNHRRILQADDSAAPAFGKVGLLTVADSVTYFDDFRIYPK